MKRINLNDGNSVPVLGLGTWKSETHNVGQAVEYAITKAGYRHIDCASIYKNEKEIGQAFGDSFNKVKREEVFITSKLWNTDHKSEHVENACKQTLSDLQLEYLDLYLMHWGVAFAHGKGLEPLDAQGNVILDTVSVQETWKAMENLVKKGLVKSIGVANFTAIMLVDLLTYATIKPAMNQIELHPYNTQEALVTFCKLKKIAVTAYSPLGRQGQLKSAGEGPKLVDEPIMQKIAKKHKKTPAQVLLNWGIGRGTIVIPKSVTPDRIKENIDVFAFSLTQEEMGEIGALNKNYRFVNPNEWWGIPYFG